MEKVAYFCLEYAIEDDLAIYAGGLGVLAGDLLLEAGQQGRDWTGIGLLYAKSSPESFGFQRLPQVFIPIENQEIKVQAWIKKYGSARLILLQASPITDCLYCPDDLNMLKQQIILGFGGVKLLKGFKPDIFHLNEGHTAMAILALAGEFAKSNPGVSLKSALESIKPKVVVTKHTILPRAGLHLPWELVQKYLGPILEKYKFSFTDLVSVSRHKNDPDLFSTTQLLLNFSARSSAVSLPHAQFEKVIHPGSALLPIVNGVNQKRWQSSNFKLENKKDLAGYLLSRFQMEINPQALLIIWARRFALYKRPTLLFSDLMRLKQIVNIPGREVQIIIAGKISSQDPESKKMAREIGKVCQQPDLSGKVFFVPQYDIPLAKKLTAGADVWLNTPMPGQEASGTSGMKAGLNGALQLSTADGWMVEQNWQEFGWILFEENIKANIYNVIEKEVIPLYFDHPEQWQERAKKTRKLIEEKYTTVRVLQDYFHKLYTTSMG